MCDTGPDVRSGELSEGFLTSLRARVSRRRPEHSLRVPSCDRARLEICVGRSYLALSVATNAQESCGLASPMYFRELLVVLGVVSLNTQLYLHMSRPAMCSIFVLQKTKMARGGLTRWRAKVRQAALF